MIGLGIIGRSFVLWLFCAFITSGVAKAAELNYRFVDGDGGVPLMVVEAGDPAGPGILFIHGFSLNSASWRAQLTADSLQKFHMIAFDARGHGASGKPWRREDYGSTEVWANDIAAVMEATGLEKPVLVGWSMGGYLVMNYVRHFGPDAVAGINLVGALGGLAERPAPGQELDESYRQAQSKQMSLNLIDNIEGQRPFVAFMTAKPVPEEDAELMHISTLQLPVYVRQAMNPLPLDNTDLVDKLTTPVLFTFGVADFSVPQPVVESLVEQLPNAQSAIYDGVGHSPFYEATETFNRDLAAFVDRVTGHDSNNKRE